MSQDTSTWVSRIEMDGLEEPPGGNVFQTGYVDDLFFGTAIPEPASALLVFLGLAFVASRRRRR